MPEQTTRDRILRIAQDLFTSKGFANASVREICERAAIAPPTLYYHFGDKDGLYKAVVEETLSLDGFREVLRQAVTAASDPRAKLRAYVGSYLTSFPTQLLNPGLHLQSSTRLNETSLQRLQTGIGDIYQVAREVLQEGIDRGRFRKVDVDRAAACLMGSVDSFVRGEVYLGVGYEREEVTDCIVDLFTYGLTTRSVEDGRPSPAAAEPEPATHGR
ncbi:MAG: TetR/AcrR family transcriptional regulator [Chloroflexota bacterium]